MRLPPGWYQMVFQEMDPASTYPMRLHAEESVKIVEMSTSKLGNLNWSKLRWRLWWKLL